MTPFDCASYQPLNRKQHKWQADVEREYEETVVIGGSLYKGNPRQFAWRTSTAVP